eukprot:1182110-Rhodomonas_salina.2
MHSKVILSASAMIIKRTVKGAIFGASSESRDFRPSSTSTTTSRPPVGRHFIGLKVRASVGGGPGAAPRRRAADTLRVGPTLLPFRYPGYPGSLVKLESRQRST